MTLKQFYEFNQSGTRVYDFITKEQITITQYTKTHLYEVMYFYAINDDCICVEVKQ